MYFCGLIDNRLKTKIMANTKPQPKQGEVENVSEALSRSEQFIEKNQKTLLWILVAIFVVVAGILLYVNNYVAPKEKVAQTQIFKGEQYLAVDSFALALNGDDMDYIGFEAIAKQYKVTRTGRLANAYMGLCYKGMGDYELAAKYLAKGAGKDMIASPALTGAAGDCYVELGNAAKAVSYFEKAAKGGNSMLAPIYLMKAGLAYESLGQYGKALKAYETIKAEYPNSVEGSDIDKYIARAKLAK